MDRATWVSKFNAARLALWQSEVAAAVCPACNKGKLKRAGRYHRCSRLLCRKVISIRGELIEDTGDAATALDWDQCTPEQAAASEFSRCHIIVEAVDQPIAEYLNDWS